jgi:hypothetical protein
MSDLLAPIDCDGVRRYVFWSNIPIYDNSKGPPPDAVYGRERAAYCSAHHAWGDVLIASTRTSCPGCGGQGRRDHQSWDIPCAVKDGRTQDGEGYRLVRKTATDWKPDIHNLTVKDGAVSHRDGGKNWNAWAARLFTALRLANYDKKEAFDHAARPFMWLPLPRSSPYSHIVLKDHYKMADDKIKRFLPLLVGRVDKLLAYQGYKIKTTVLQFATAWLLIFTSRHPLEVKDKDIAFISQWQDTVFRKFEDMYGQGSFQKSLEREMVVRLFELVEPTRKSKGYRPLRRYFGYS